MLSGEGNKNGEKRTIGLISKKAPLHVQHTFLYISLPLFCTTTTWNFQKLPDYTFFGASVVRVLVHFFLLSLIFTPVTAGIFHFLTAATQFSCCSFNKRRLLCFFSLALADFLIELRWPVALLSLFLSLSLSRYSKFVDMTINLSFFKKYLRQHGYRNIFRLLSCLCLTRHGWPYAFPPK